MKKQLSLAFAALATIAQPLQAKDFFSRLNDRLMENPYWGIGLGLFTGIALTGIGFHSYYGSLLVEKKKNPIVANDEEPILSFIKQLKIGDSSTASQGIPLSIRIENKLKYCNSKIQELASQNADLKNQLNKQKEFSTRFKNFVSACVSLMAHLRSLR